MGFAEPAVSTRPTVTVQSYSVCDGFPQTKQFLKDWEFRQKARMGEKDSRQEKQLYLLQFRVQDTPWD